MLYLQSQQMLAYLITPPHHSISSLPLVCGVGSNYNAVNTFTNFSKNRYEQKEHTTVSNRTQDLHTVQWNYNDYGE
jgi:hypothetical protein